VSQLPATRGRSSRLARGVAVLVLTLTPLAACGGADDGGDSAAATSTSSPTSTTDAAPSTTTEVEAPPATQTLTATEADFSISVDREDLTAGSYEIEVVNDGSATHDLVVERDGEDVAASEMIPPGGSGTVTVDLEPGEYVFYCSVGNHRSMGMEITVQVTA
jgi:plastocyanin